jgi:hypothetical protein
MTDEKRPPWGADWPLWAKFLFFVLMVIVMGSLLPEGWRRGLDRWVKNGNEQPPAAQRLQRLQRQGGAAPSPELHRAIVPPPPESVPRPSFLLEKN